jgi:hypothetical protein
MNYDIIGDVHGHADKLKSLLGRLGYRESGGAWKHAQREAIFVGDFIDRGPRQLETLDIVRRMVDSGAAKALMGNHEFNAIAWYTEDPDHPGKHLRPRDGEIGAKNAHQHRAFLEELGHRPDEYRRVIDWFYTLPVWLELPGLRVVHACWHAESMRALQPQLRPGNLLSEDLVISSSRRGTGDYKAVETVLKGLEVKLPAGRSFKDKDGHERDAMRVRWWDASAVTFKQAGVTGGKDHELPDDPLPSHARMSDPRPEPVFFGHYWMTGTPAVQTPTAACVDYSAGRGGDLVAYRWDGEPALDSAKFVSA